MTSSLLRTALIFVGILPFFAMTPLSPAKAGDGVTATHAASDWVVNDQTKVRLISATDGHGGRDTVRLGLQFKLDNNWKVYWRNPGDAGYPPRVDWAKSENLGETTFAWPAPIRFSILGFETMGYKHEVVFPITAKVTDPDKPLRLKAKLDYLTCDDVCIPYTTNVSFEVPRGTGAATDNAHLISQYDAKVPGDGSNVGITIDSVDTAGALGPEKDAYRDGTLRVHLASAVPFEDLDIFPEGPDTILFGKPSFALSDGNTKAIARIPVSVEKGHEIEQANLTFTVTDGPRAAERALTVGAGPADAPSTIVGNGQLPVSLFVVLGLALIGGLILNLMPCVLPVISLKVLGVVGHGGGENRIVRRSFVATSAGIVFSFLVLAGALTILKLAGMAVGWGIQFQHPWFLVGLALIVTLFAYNLWGLFEIQLPTRLATVIASPDHGAEQGVAGNFLTGAFATLLATPCSAPFLGTAVGFALAGSTADIFAVFAALGIGMASPFLAIAAFPSLATKLPRPGPWMVRLKQIMGFALAVTTLWLLSVLAVQVSVTAAIIVGVLMAAIGVILYARTRLPDSIRRYTMGALAVLAIVAFIVPHQITPRATLESPEQSAHWVPFEPERIPELVAAGKTVFVDITAEWCITCQVNKAAVLNRGQVSAFLQGDDVIAMKGDWTRPDPVIADYLMSFNRFGIPFNAVYGPGAVQGIALPELLTSDLVLDGIEKASAGALAAKR